MLLFRLTLLLSLICYLAAYPVEVPVKPAGQENRVALDPADYPDLTNGLSDAEVESTLNGLSLEDLNALNKLLDDANNGPVELEASLRGHHRQAKKQHYEEMENTDDEQSVNDNCHDEDDLDKERDPCTVRPKCNKPPTCPTTKRCTSTRRCFTTSCKSLDGLLNINFDGERSNKKYRKLNAKPQEECDPEDVLCIQRNRDKAKQRPNMQDFSDLSLDQDQGNNIDSLEKLAAEAHQDQSLELHKDLDGWQSKGEPSADIFNLDPYKVPNVDSNGNANDLKESPKLTGLIAEDEGQPAQSEEEAKPGEVESPYERHQLARVAHEDHLKADEEQQPEEIEDNRQLNAAPALSQERYNDDLEVEAGEPHGNLAANEGNEGDSFIAQNAREPMRYVIQTDDGLIQSENEQGEHKLRTDKQHSEMLNFATYQLAKEANPQLEFKRFKRDNKKTDDAPENSNESYLKKLMDSFPRDQVSQSNLNIAIREAKRAHLRVKRC